MSPAKELLTRTQLLLLCVALVAALAVLGQTSRGWHPVSCAELARHPNAKTCRGD